MAYTKDGNSVSTANVLSTESAAVGTFRGKDWYSYLKDAQGSTSSILKEDGSLAAAYDYTDFGETEEISGSGFDNEICYTGAVYDVQSGLYYMNARYYDPENGRFISQDSYRGEMDDPGQWHLYAYCANNPVNYVDPSGHKWVNRTVTRRCYAPVIDGGHQVWRVTTSLSVEYKKKSKNKTITKMTFRATGDKHTTCGNGTCIFVNVKIYKGGKWWKTIKGTSKLVKPGDGVILSVYRCCYTDKKIDKDYSVGSKK